MAFCSKCGTQIPDDAKFCPACGNVNNVVPQNNSNDEQDTTVLSNGQNGNTQQQTQQAESQGDSTVTQIDFGAQQQAAQPNINAQQPQGYNGQYSNQYNGQQPQKNKTSFKEKFNKFLHNKKAVGGVIAALVVIIAVIVGVCIYNYNKKKVNINDCISVEFTGYDTRGKAKVDIDYDKFSDAVAKAKGKSSSSSSYDWDEILEGVSTYQLKESIEIEVTPNENLKNGDKVTVKITYDNDLAKKAGIRFSAKEQEFTVEGLKEVTMIDPFEHLEVIYSGTAPNGSAKVTYTGGDGVLSSSKFKISQSSKLSNGDKITVTVSMSEDSALAKGYAFTQTSKEYTVSGLKEYVSKCADITGDALASLQKGATDVIDSKFAGNEDKYTKSELKYEGMYILSSKTGNRNRVYLVYSTTITSTDGAFNPINVYYPVRIDSVYKDADGKIQTSDTTYTISGSSTMIDNSGNSRYVLGYTDTSKMFSDVITENKSQFEYDMTEGLKQFGQ